MKLRFIIILFSVLIFISCRYKDNDKFVVATVKQRIEKTWYLKKCDLNGITLENYFNDLTNNTITFSEMKKNTVMLSTNYDRGLYYSYLFDDNKTKLYKVGLSRDYSLKITKLTKDELWLEGDRIINSVGGLLTDKVKAKYSSKK